MIVVISIIVSGFIYIGEYKNQLKTEELKFQSQANIKFNSFENDFKKYLNNNETIANHLEITLPISYQNFHLYTQKLIETVPAIQSYEWIPVVTAVNRKELEIEIRKNYPEFRIFQHSHNGDKIDIQSNVVNYPIYFVEPYLGNEKALGFDVSSDPIRYKTILTAQNTGKITISPKVTFMRFKEKKVGVLIINPIYDKYLKPTKSKENIPRLVGFVASTLSLEEAIKTNLRVVPNNNLRFQIIDITNRDEAQELLSKSTFKMEEGANEYIENSLFTSERQMDLAGRKYLIKAQAAPNAFLVNNNWDLWGYPIVVSCLTLLALIYLYLERKRKKFILDSELNFKTLLGTMPNGILLYNFAHEIIFSNDVVNRLFEINTEHQKLSNSFKLDHLLPLDWLKHIRQLEDLLRSNSINKELISKKLVVPNHDKTIVEIALYKTIFGEQSIYVLTLHDLAEKTKFQEALQFTLMHDSLTNLPNRLLLDDRLKQTQAENERNKNYGGLLFIDIDHFKQINDSYGHTQGDLLLQTVATRLQNTVRKIDTVSRFGGDEFVIVLHELGSCIEESGLIADEIANKILKSINEEIYIAHRRHFVSVSIGITIFNGFTKSAETILQEADLAMYQAKEDGRNRAALFHSEIRYKNDVLNTLFYELQTAVEEKQFILLYQPQLNTELKVIGVEALLRWNHPTKGLIMPDDFLMMAEHSEYIYLLGDYITEIAISQLAKWQKNDSTKHLTMSINISPRQFEKENFVKNFFQLILKYKVDPSQVILEITENSLTRDIEQLMHKFHQLSDLGVLLSIDDFGTGYSSLEFLFKLPIHQLKIDRSFIKNIVDDVQLQIITKTIIGLAKNLNLIVVVEGVETKSQEKWCIDHGCNILQGFLYASALSASEFDEVNFTKLNFDLT